jgi:hypothetical protein
MWLDAAAWGATPHQVFSNIATPPVCSIWNTILFNTPHLSVGAVTSPGQLTGINYEKFNNLTSRVPVLPVSSWRIVRWDEKAGLSGIRYALLRAKRTGRGR